MEQLPLKETKHITDPAAARFLTDPLERQMLVPFMGEGISLGEAAKQLGLQFNTLHYRVQRLMKLGLVERVSEQPRKGRAVKLYRATSQEFIVPFSATPNATIEELFLENGQIMLKVLMSNFARVLLERADEWAFHLTFEEGKQGIIMQMRSQQLHPADESITSAAWLSDLGLKLDVDTAKRLEQELAELFQRYYALEQDGESNYYLSLGLVPLYKQKP